MMWEAAFCPGGKPCAQPSLLSGGRLKTRVLAGRLLARYVLLRFWPSESVPPEEKAAAARRAYRQDKRQLPHIMKSSPLE